jgi:hypothetical protein
MRLNVSSAAAAAAVAEAARGVVASFVVREEVEVEVDGRGGGCRGASVAAREEEVEAAAKDSVCRSGMGVGIGRRGMMGEDGLFGGVGVCTHEREVLGEVMKENNTHISKEITGPCAHERMQGHED